MRAVIQRVQRAEVRVDGEVVARTGRGFLVLLGVEQGDGTQDVEYVADKVAGLRVFEDAEGKMNLALEQVGGEVLLVSQFTLLGDCRKGRRPSFGASAPPEEAEALYRDVAERIGGYGIPVRTGRFRAEMAVELINDGPVTLLLESRRVF